MGEASSEMSLYDTRNLIEALFTESLDLLCVARTDGYFQHVNPAFTETFGFTEEELLSRPILDLVHPEDRTDVQEQLSKLDVSDRVKFECRCHCRGDTWKWISWHVPAPINGMLYMVARDVTEAKRAEATLVKAANTDCMTGLLNRSAFVSSLAGKIALAEQHKYRIAVLFVDLDGFKEVNDTHGHDIGDYVIRYSAEVLRSSVRHTDCVARLGGDEFAVLLDNLARDEDVETAVEKVRGTLQNRLLKLPSGDDLHISASVGVAVYPDSGSDPEALLKAADKKMYTVKGGRT